MNQYGSLSKFCMAKHVGSITIRERTMNERANLQFCYPSEHAIKVQLVLTVVGRRLTAEDEAEVELRSAAAKQRNSRRRLKVD